MIQKDRCKSKKKIDLFFTTYRFELIVGIVFFLQQSNGSNLNLSSYLPIFFSHLKQFQLNFYF